VDVEYISAEQVVKSGKEGYITLGKVLNELSLVKEIKKGEIEK